ncbi:MAG TPA: acyclic terpene utilization AtuA family protein [Blastocatellia bacterium]|nr:acyclic terpene utilization AtuA family protein [Blastocatellia bacterium]
MKTIRIANGQGFWGDSLEAPIQLVERGTPDSRIDYLTLDYLAEITMSILQKQKSRDPNAGYARDFLYIVGRVLPKCIDHGIKIIANAGGVNPQACVAGVAEIVKKLGLSGKVRVGVVAGDDIMGSLDDLIARGIELKNMETGEALSTIRDRVQSANVYFGAAPIARALGEGAQIIITGRCTDTGLALAPMMHEFKWAHDDWDKIAAGTIAGHIIECGAQCTGGNCQVEWPNIPDLWDIGYPVIEASEDATFIVTKHPGTGGRITVAGITEQLMYEMGDPKAYITPDCIADFTTVRLAQDGENRVRVSGIKGQPATDLYKVSISYSSGFKAVGGLIYSWPDAYNKAKAADAILRRRLEALGLKYDETLTQFVGVNATHEGLGGEPSPELAEVMMRVGVRSGDKAAVERFTKELAPLALNGPPTVTGFGSGRPKVEEIVAYWPALIPKTAVTPKVEVITV